MGMIFVDVFLTELRKGDKIKEMTEAHVGVLEIITSSTPFEIKLEEVLDRNFPPKTGKGEVRGKTERDYPEWIKGIDLLVETIFTKAVMESRALEGEDFSPPRSFSAPEIAVGFALLAGEEYKLGGRMGSFHAGLGYVPGTISFEVGNRAVQLLDAIYQGEKSRTQTILRTLCAMVITRSSVTALTTDLGKIFEGIGVREYWDEKEARGRVRELLMKRETDGELPKGAVQWFDEFLRFFDFVKRTPFQSLLLNYGYFIKDPFDPNIPLKIGEIYERQKKIGCVDPKVKAAAEFYGLIPSQQETSV